MTDAIEQIRRAHRSAMPNPVANPAWANAERDIGVLLGEIDRQADIIERQSKALDEAMMVVWWMIGEGIVPADYDIDPDQVMLDNVENITGDSGEYWEAMFESRSLSNKGKGDE